LWVNEDFTFNISEDKKHNTFAFSPIEKEIIIPFDWILKWQTLEKNHPRYNFNEFKFSLLHEFSHFRDAKVEEKTEWRNCLLFRSWLA
jgi:hypothetical protein